MYTKEWMIHAAVIVLVILIFIRVFRTPYTRDWVIVFLLKAYIASFVGVIVVKHGWIDYPVRLLPEYFDNSILFEYLAFPASCLLFNLTTLHSDHRGIILQTVLYSGVMSAVEVALEQHSQVIRYHGWMWYDTFVTLAVTFLMVRYAMYGIRKLSRIKASI